MKVFSNQLIFNDLFPILNNGTSFAIATLATRNLQAERNLFSICSESMGFVIAVNVARGGHESPDLETTRISANLWRLNFLICHLDKQGKKMKLPNIAKKLAPATLAALFCVGTAQAAIVNTWSWYNEAGFTAWTPTNDVKATGNSGSQVGGKTKLAWGNDNPQSSLTTGSGHASGTTTLGTQTFGVGLTHNNFPITGAALTSANLRDRLFLVAGSGGVTPPNGALPTINFDIHFVETPNNPGSICDDGTTNNTGLNINGCGDLLGIASAVQLTQMFTLDDFLYTVTIGAAGLGPMSNTQCNMLNLTNGCVGFKTIENQTNALNPFFTITAQARTTVPEPGALLLLGIGLAGMGWSRRKTVKI